MAKFLLGALDNAVVRLENVLAILFGRQPPPALCVVPVQELDLRKHNIQNDVLNWDGIFWAVPKHRRTLEKRLKRKYGMPEYVWKMLKPKTNLRVCNQCGKDHEVGVLCPHCYEEVRKETELMQEKIQEELGLNPVDKEVIVLYDGEKDQPPEFYEGKRIVEMKKSRPMWFSKNLMQKTTQQPATTKEVKPNDLA
uniref:Large ribosomal subunit protein bL32m n=1 Tax=Tabanus bromius TaxID=304241 RepID=A0A0K8TSF4_TABBR